MAIPPPPTAFKVTLNYVQFNRQWSEDFWSNQPDFPSVVAKVNNILTPATAFRHWAVYINYVRISNPFAARQSQIIHLRVADPPATLTDPAVTSTAAIYRLNTNQPGVSRSIWLRGLRADSIGRRQSTGQDFPAGGLDSGVQAYWTALVANGFGVLSLVPVDTSDNKRHPIPSITVLAPPMAGSPSQVQINTPDVYSVNATNRVILYRINQKLFPGLSGHFTVQPAVGNFIPQGYLTPMEAGTYNLTGAAFRAENYRFSSFIYNVSGQTNNCQFVEFDRRDTKGGPSSTRGRSRAKIRRSA
jgi:hypothetical protein